MAKTPACRYGRDRRYKHKVRCRKAPAKGARRSPAAAMALEGHGRRRRRRR